MKKLLLTAGTVLVLSALFSCRTESRKTEVPEGEWKDMEITLRTDDISQESVSYTVEPEDAELSYFVHFIKESSYVDDKTLQSDDMQLIADMAEKAGSELSDAIASVLKKGKVSDRIEGLEPGTGYYLYAYRMDENGKSGKVAKIPFKTADKEDPQPEITFSFEVTEQTPVSLEIVTECSDAETYYCTDLMEAVYYDELGGGNAAILQYFKDIVAYSASNYGLTPEEFVKQVYIKGTDKYKYTELSQDTDYYVYAVVVDAEGNISDVCSYQKLRTSAVEKSDMKLEISVSNIKPDQADVTVTPDKDDLYLVNVFYASELSKFENDQEIMDAVIKKFGASVETKLKFGEKTQTFYNLDPDTEWVALAFGYDSGVSTTGLFKKTFKTLKSGEASDLDFEITVDAKQFKADVTYKPSKESIRYAYEIMAESTYNEYGADAAAIQKYYKELIQRLIEQQPTLTVKDVVSQITAKNEFTYKMSFLTPEKDYITWAAACDEEGNLLSDPVVVNFRTKPYVLSKETAVQKLEMYFNGGEVAEVDPYLGVSDRVAVGFFRTTLSEGAVMTWTAVYAGDYTSQEEYPDYKLAAKMENDGNKNANHPMFALEWDKELTVCAFAIDAEGNYGPIQREKIVLTKDGVNPISEYPMFWPFSKERDNEPVKYNKFGSRELDLTSRYDGNAPSVSKGANDHVLQDNMPLGVSPARRGMMVSPERMKQVQQVRNYGRSLHASAR